MPHRRHPSAGDVRQRTETVLVLAWVVSIGVHVALFASMVTIPWISRQAPARERSAVTATRLDFRDAKVKTRVVRDKPRAARSEHVARALETIQPEIRHSLSELDHPVDRQRPIVGIGTGGGTFAKYGLHAGPAGAGPRFFGLGPDTRAVRKIVYVVDRSASMLEVFVDVQAELKRSINSLRKSQRFCLLFYSSGTPLEYPQDRMASAIRDAKEGAFRFIDTIVPEGKTDELGALKRAFLLKPDIIYFLSDGGIYDSALLLSKLREWNVDRRVRIFTIAYVFRDGRELLERIAREHDGMFRFVSEYDLE